LPGRLAAARPRRPESSLTAGHVMKGRPARTARTRRAGSARSDAPPARGTSAYLRSCQRLRPRMVPETSPVASWSSPGLCRWPRGPGGPAAADDVAVPAQDRVQGNQQSRPLAPCFGYHAEGRGQGPVRPGQFWRRDCRRCKAASWWRRMQDFRGLPGLLTERAAASRPPAFTRRVRGGNLTEWPGGACGVTGRGWPRCAAKVMLGSGVPGALTKDSKRRSRSACGWPGK